MGAGGFKDHFSGHAADYARARPDYPASLFRFLAGLLPVRSAAWDCATGNGQAARALQRYFPRIVATDASAEQIAAAEAADGIEFRVAPAEDCGLESASVELVTCAQALHWFDRERFFAEAARVLKPGGVLAAWCYGNCRIDPACDRIVQGLYRSLDPWWPPERQLVESGYRDIELPGEPLDAPRFAMWLDWRAEALLDYLGTWSAARRCRADTGKDPVQAIAAELRRTWGSRRRRVTWPLTLRATRL